MHLTRPISAILTALAVSAGSAAAQQTSPATAPAATAASPRSAVYLANRFAPAPERPEAATDSTSLADRLRLEPMPRRSRTSHALIGGAIGAVTGLLTCTVISNLVNSDVEGTTTCDTKAYVAFAAGGFAVGAVIGAMIR